MLYCYRHIPTYKNKFFMINQMVGCRRSHCMNIMLEQLTEVGTPVFLDERGIPAATMTDGTPRGYAFLNITGNKYTINYKISGKPQEYQMDITHPKVVMQNRHTPTYIVVNFFMGSSNNKVEYRIDEGPWNLMTRTVMYDPNYVNMLYQWNSSEETKLNRWPSDASLCSHIWRTRIPPNLPLGKHVIEVKATDIFGRNFIQKSEYRIDKPLKYYR